MAATPEIRLVEELPSAAAFHAKAPQTLAELREIIAQARELIEKSRALMAKADELLAKQ